VDVVTQSGLVVGGGNGDTQMEDHEEKWNKEKEIGVVTSTNRKREDFCRRDEKKEKDRYAKERSHKSVKKKELYNVHRSLMNYGIHASINPR